jgi:hypothetical protein
LAPTTYSGFEHGDFSDPAGHGNALSQEGRALYLDFQSFMLGRYGDFLSRIVDSAREASHFGAETVFRGGKYLYQSVPGLGVLSKRDCSVRLPLLEKLLAQAGQSLNARVVLDIGCNLGMMMAEYLRLGAAWCHGWDLPKLIPHTERVLLAIGCSRHSLTAAALTSGYDLGRDLPPFIQGGLEGCIVSYLSVHRHLGWLESLVKIPWSLMIYEGHEGEDQAALDRNLGELSALVPHKVLALTFAADGDSKARPLTLLGRL